MMKQILADRNGTCVSIHTTDDGEIRFDGQMLRGSSEYEYCIIVEPKDFDTIRLALGGSDDADMQELIMANRVSIFEQGEATWLKSLGIEYGFSNYFDSDFFG